MGLSRVPQQGDVRRVPGMVHGFEPRLSHATTRIETKSYFVSADNTYGDSGNSSVCTRHDSVDLEVTSHPDGGRCNIGWGEADGVVRLVRGTCEGQ